MKQNGFFALMSRMRYIPRWTLMRNTSTETVYEHSFTVAMIAHALALIAKNVFGKEVDEGLCTAVAMYHDAPEILTGDLPTPVKYFNPAIRNEYAKVEKSAVDKLMSMLPPSLYPSYKAIFSCEEENPEVFKIVKAADRLSAYIKCIEEQNSGNSDFNSAAEEIMKTLNDNPLPELRYFMDNFLDSYMLTLDEME